MVVCNNADFYGSVKEALMSKFAGVSLLCRTVDSVNGNLFNNLTNWSHLAAGRIQLSQALAGLEALEALGIVLKSEKDYSAEEKAALIGECITREHVDAKISLAKETLAQMDRVKDVFHSGKTWPASIEGAHLEEVSNFYMKFLDGMDTILSNDELTEKFATVGAKFFDKIVETSLRTEHFVTQRKLGWIAKLLAKK